MELPLHPDLVWSPAWAENHLYFEGSESLSNQIFLHIFGHFCLLYFLCFPSDSKFPSEPFQRLGLVGTRSGRVGKVQLGAGLSARSGLHGWMGRHV